MNAMDEARRGRLLQARLRRFTLIELLVVVSIMAVLASLLLPALSSAREKGRQTACLGCLRQWGVAESFYVDAFNGWSMRYKMLNSDSGEESAWNHYYCYPRESLAPGVAAAKWGKGLSFNGCPSRSAESASFYADRYYSYGINYYVSSDAIASALVARPATTKGFSSIVLLAELCQNEMGFQFAVNADRVGYPHSDASNALFGDGHCAAKKLGSYQLSDFKPAQ